MNNKLNTYIPLHGHSTYSQGDGVCKIEDIVKRAKDIDVKGIALTEHGNMSSFYKFYKICKENDINPIIGCELYVNDLYYNDNKEFLRIKRDKESKEKEKAANNHITVYCKNYQGVKNLIGLSNIGYKNFYRSPLVSTNLILEKLDNNNIVTTGCLASAFNRNIVNDNTKETIRLIKLFYDKFGSDFYFEILLNDLEEQEKCNSFYKKICEKIDIKPVFSLDYHYVEKGGWYIQYLLHLIKNRKTISGFPESEWYYSVRDLYIKNIDEIYELSEKFNINKEFFEDAINSTIEINEKVNIELPLYPDNFPKFNINKEESKEQFIQKLKIKWKEKVENNLIPSDKIEEYKKRLKYELDIIIKKDFVDYFLILDDLLNNFVYKGGGATGAGRGSAPGSLVLFVFDITKIDPIKHNLIFERFLNPSRTDPSDVDLDVDSETQKLVEDYLKEKYGKDKVCHIANFGRFGAKTTIKDLCRIFELSFTLSNRLTSYFSGTNDQISIKDELKKAFNIAKSKNEIDLVEFIKDNKELFVDIGEKFIGLIRQSGRHASGILVSNKNFDEGEIPIVKLKGEIITAIQEGGDDREVGELGFCKLDILGLRAVSIINDTIKLVEQHYDINNIEQRILKSDLDDSKIYNEFKKGRTRDIFQFGSDSMINLLKEVKPKSINDLSSINSLYRPAVIEAGGVDSYLNNRGDLKNTKKILDKVHLKLWDIVGETAGVPIFQEQIMFILQKIGNFTLAEADDGRKILKLLHKGNQEKTENFHKMIEEFKKRALQNGVKENNVEWLLEILGKYSEYSFCCAHSLSYAMNAYILMWLRVYYPKEYFSTLFNFASKDDLSIFFKQAKSKGVRISNLKFNKTDDKFSVDYDNNRIKFGLNIIKGVQSKDINKINNIKAKNIYELVEEIIKNKISKRTIDPLCRLQYFDKIFKNSKVLEYILIEAKKIKKNKNIKEEIDIFINENQSNEDWSEQELLQFEKKYLEFYFNVHPFEKKHNQLRIQTPDFYRQIYSPKQLQDNVMSTEYIICGIVSDIIMKKSKKNNKEYYRIVIEDEQKQIGITAFNSRDIVDINGGDFIVLSASKNRFGFTKTKKIEISKV